MSKTIQLDNHSFNVDHYASMSEKEFIEAELPSVVDSYGNDAAKTEFLKKAFDKIKKAGGVTEKKGK